MMTITGMIESIAGKNDAQNCLRVFSNALSACLSDKTSYRNNRKKIWDFRDKSYELQYSEE